MIRAFSTLGCPELGFEDTLSLAARFGLGAVELRALDVTVDVPGVLSRTFGTPALPARDRSGGPPGHRDVRADCLSAELEAVVPRHGVKG